MWGMEEERMGEERMEEGRMEEEGMEWRLTKAKRRAEKEKKHSKMYYQIANYTDM